jgi:photosystem II stability/assembly factor-like uncharacterized protein
MVFFSSKNIGYIVGYDGVILKTTDCGSSWILHPFGSGNTMLYSVYFVNDTIGYLGGFNESSQYWSAELYRTNNGGTTWDYQYSGLYPSGPPTSLFFANKDTGFATGMGMGLTKTTDGGQNWIPVYTPYFYFRSGLYTSRDTAFLVGDGGVNLISNDAGNTWLSPHTATYNDLHSVFFPENNNNIGYAAGNQGTIVKTTDGGFHWTNLNTPTSSTLFSCFFINELKGYAVGEYGTIIHTADGGSTWQNQTSGVTVTLRSVFFVSSNDTIVGYAIGNTYGSGDNTLLKTIDDGNTWQVMTSPSDWSSYDIHFTDLKTGYTVGVQGSISKTIDGGVSWSYLNSGTTYDLHSIFFVNDSTCYVTGEHGVILKSNNGGATWIVLWAVNFSSPEVGYVIETNGNLLKTSNGGLDWYCLGRISTGYFNDIFFTDPNAGYIVGTDGSILKTSDGGGPVFVNEHPPEESMITIYPNPASNWITIKNNRSFSGETNVAIYSIQGKLLLQKKFRNKNSLEINITRLSKGIYFVKIQTNPESVTRKLVVQ